MHVKQYDELQHLTISDQNSFWIRVNKLIKVKKLKQETVAEIIHVSHASLRGWSYRKVYPDLIDIYHLAQVLDTSIDYLIFGTDEPPQNNIFSVLGKKVYELLEIISVILKKPGSN